MKFGVFDYIEGGDAILARSYQDRIHLIQALEANGFYSYHRPRHSFFWRRRRARQAGFASAHY
jgi:hypothetical protein